MIWSMAIMLLGDLIGVLLDKDTFTSFVNENIKKINLQLIKEKNQYIIINNNQNIRMYVDVKEIGNNELVISNIRC